jgi:hypothetical protein
MTEEVATTRFDEALALYLHAPDEAAAELALSRLLYEQAEPIISGILRHKLQVTLRDADAQPDNQAALELRGELRLQLLAELEAFRLQPERAGLEDFRRHVAAAAYQACHTHLRRKHPNRYNLRNKLRYLLTHDAEFALKEVEARELLSGARLELLAGFAAWPNRAPTRNEELWEALREEPREWAALNWPGRNIKKLHPTELLRGLFANTQGPVELDELVNVCAAIWGVNDEPNGGAATAESSLPASGQALGEALQMEQTEHLRQLWREAKKLTARQKTALLLNLRDANGHGVLRLLPLTGVAYLREIAGVLGLEPEQLAEIWAQLPLDDIALAERLNLTRQQVINLRRAARERLARRVQWQEI